MQPLTRHQELQRLDTAADYAAATRGRHQPDRANCDRGAIDAVRAAHGVCQLISVQESLPHVTATTYWRHGANICIHGSNSSGPQQVRRALNQDDTGEHAEHTV